MPDGKPWMKFLNTFADAMHAENKTLSVFVCGCCGWVDKEKPLTPIGHCNGDANGEYPLPPPSPTPCRTDREISLVCVKRVWLPRRDL